MAILLFSIVNKKPGRRDFAQSMTVEQSEDLFFIYQTTRYPSRVEVTQPPQENEHILIGLSIDPFDLNFGLLQPGGGAGRRTIEALNLQDDDVKIILESYGNISSMVTFDKNNLILKEGEYSEITAILRTTDETLPGNYTGEIDVIVKKPKYKFIYPFL